MRGQKCGSLRGSTCSAVTELSRGGFGYHVSDTRHNSNLRKGFPELRFVEFVDEVVKVRAQERKRLSGQSQMT
jgi:hypothetical protein